MNILITMQKLIHILIVNLFLNNKIRNVVSYLILNSQNFFGKIKSQFLYLQIIFLIKYIMIDKKKLKATKRK